LRDYRTKNKTCNYNFNRNKTVGYELRALVAPRCGEQRYDDTMA